MYTLGINLSHHSSIALLKDNVVLLFIHEDRLNRKKYFQGIPYKSLDLVKDYTTTIDHITLISGSQYNLNKVVKYLNKQGVVVNSHKRSNELHHMAHAAAGFYMSGMNNACVVVIDGAGAIEHLG